MKVQGQLRHMSALWAKEQDPGTVDGWLVWMQFDVFSIADCQPSNRSSIHATANSKTQALKPPIGFFTN